MYKIAKKTKNKEWKYYKLFDKHYAKSKTLDKYESCKYLLPVYIQLIGYMKRASLCDDTQQVCLMHLGQLVSIPTSPTS